MKPTYIQVLITKKKASIEARIKRILFKSKGSVLYFDVLHVQIFIQPKYSGGHEIWVKIIKNAGNFFKYTGGERVNIIIMYIFYAISIIVKLCNWL